MYTLACEEQVQKLGAGVASLAFSLYLVVSVQAA